MHEIFNQINMEPLIKLRDYFKTLPAKYGKFDMSCYATNENDDSLYPLDVPDCSTSMCLLGHLPLLGYPGLEDEGWHVYCHRVLNIVKNMATDTVTDDEYVWNYLFSYRWPSDIQLAVQRLDDVINKRKTVIETDIAYLTIVIKDYNNLFI